MGWDDGDVYFTPEKFGLQIVAQAEDEPNYDFNMFVVWKHEDGRFFFATDSGCSCPTPFEDFTSLDFLTESKPHDIVAAAKEWASNCYNGTPDVAQLIEKVMAL